MAGPRPTPHDCLAMTSLDAADPLVLDTRPLGRRAGAMTKVSRTFPAPAGWAVSSSHVPVGSPVDLQVRLEGVVEGVLVSGSVTVITGAECSRCLEAVSGVLSIPLQQLFEYPELQVAVPDSDDDPLPTLQGYLLDLQPTVRDAVVLDLPLVPVCTLDCPGLCEICGVRLADDPAHGHDVSDTRWAALNQWLSSPATSAGEIDEDEKGD